MFGVSFAGGKNSIRACLLVENCLCVDNPTACVLLDILGMDCLTKLRVTTRPRFEVNAALRVLLVLIPDYSILLT